MIEGDDCIAGVRAHAAHDGMPGCLVSIISGQAQATVFSVHIGRGFAACDSRDRRALCPRKAWAMQHAYFSKGIANDPVSRCCTIGPEGQIGRASIAICDTTIARWKVALFGVTLALPR